MPTTIMRNTPVFTEERVSYNLFQYDFDPMRAPSSLDGTSYK